MLNFDPPVVKRSRWLQIRNRLVAVVRGGKRLDGFTKLVIVVVAAVLIPKIGSTFAGSITLNAGQAVEFGQGTVMTTACDESITITPTSRFSTADTAFYLGDITVSGLDDEECYADMFTITVFDPSGLPIDICEENSGDEIYTSNALQLAYRDSDDPLLESWVLISDCFFDQSPGGSVGSGTGFVFVPSENIVSSQVSSISIESALSTTADDFYQAVELNGSNTGTINVSTTNATLLEFEGYYNFPECEGDCWYYTNTVWFKWTATQDGNLTIDTCDSDFDTVLQAFDESWYSIAADDAGGLLTCEEDQNDPSWISFDVQKGSTHLIQLAGYEESFGLAQLNWSFVAGAIAYSVTYDCNCEDTLTVPSDSTSYSSGDLVTVADDLGTLEKNGYSFNGWCTTQSVAGAACSGDTYGVGDKFAITGDTTLYVQWEGDVLTVYLDEQEGTAIANASTTSGGSMSDPGTPTRAGYEFDGWFVARTGGSAISFPYAHGGTANFDLYAQWVETADYIVGDPGPGGGTIFYVNMRRPAGSQYFEAACAAWQHNCLSGYADPQAVWGCLGYQIPGAEGTAIGTGEQNTLDILAGCLTEDIAARLADAYTVTVNSVVYEDWFLPSKDELLAMYAIRTEGFSPYYYLSSSETVHTTSWAVAFPSGSSNIYYPKHVLANVRPVRSF
jgi:uncharacterized repeat protein (TIGR02543 family)